MEPAINQTSPTRPKLTNIETSSKEDPTFLTQNRQAKLVDSTIPHSEAINSLYKDLNNCILDLDDRVGKVLNRHEADFLNVYKGHMFNIQKEMKMLKERVSEEELKRRRDDEIRVLESERDWFRNEALRLDKICKEYKRSVEMWKNKAQALEEDRKFMEDMIMNSKKENLRLKEQMELMGSHHNTESNSLTTDIHRNFDTLRPEDLLRSSNFTPELKRYHESPESHKKYENRYQETIHHLKNQLENEKKNLRIIKSAKTNYLLERGELESFFLQSIEEVRKDISKRRLKSSHYSSRTRLPRTSSGKSIRSTNTDEDVRIDQFTDADKRRVIELLLSNEQVLLFIHENLFPKVKKARTPSSHSPAISMSAQKKVYKPLLYNEGTATSNGLHSHMFSIPYFNERSKNVVRPSTAPKVSSK